MRQVLLLVAACSIASVVASAAEPVAPAKPPVKAVPKDIPKVKVEAPPPVVISVTSFVSDNYWPDPDKDVYLTLTLKNEGQARVEHIPWSVRNDTMNKSVASGEQAALAPGESATQRVHYIPETGKEQRMLAAVDAGNTLSNTSNQKTRDFKFIIARRGKFLLRATIAGTGRGTVYGSSGSSTVINCANDTGSISPHGTCWAELDKDASATLQGLPAQGNAFQGWNSTCGNGGRDVNNRPLCLVRMTSGMAVAGAFGPN